ncbi:pentapeptide repeat-containing protein [Nostoc sp. FACHB-145]|uniref:pentapeptide repeat-containing protein n=1 Tax=Nostoc sp. FACHB-145 TaxID=2692836 RepID=UPI0016873F3A|nr:pentapeptide repeat-containing protein [Nostoc sp. FACHB-145]MBD2472677.1 pentapeptide repeat-containing protein [Nostoc sp. FACHB-145]
MVNDLHYALLMEGVQLWNEWRLNNLEITPDLSEADLSGAVLTEIDFTRTNLSNVNLSEAFLVRALFTGADLPGANLSNALLSGADLSNVNLSNALLSEADLSRASLIEADLSGANFIKAKLYETDLSRADFNRTDFTGADFTNAYLCSTDFTDAYLTGANFIGVDFTDAYLGRIDLSKVNFSRANFTKADLTKANLSRTNLTGADLSNANLIRVNFTEANLSRTQVLGTDFTGANFTGACIQDWNTNSDTNLNNVICDYIYLRQDEQERCPSSGNFAPGDFTKRFQKSLETVDLIFRNGIDWDAFAYSCKKVEVENQGAQLDVQSIEKKGDGVILVRVAVAPDADKAKIHNQFMQGYEFAAKALEAQYQARLEDKEKVINQLFSTINQQNKLLAQTGDKFSIYYQPNSQFAGGIVDATNVDAQQIGGSIQNNNTKDFPS